MKYNDKELLAQFKIKDTREWAFNLIIKKYQEKIYWHIRKIVISHEDADDVIQNTFIKVWKNLDNFREDAQLFTWLYRIATNEALSFLKQQKKNMLIPFGDNERHLYNTLESDIYFSGNEIQKKLQQAICSLPDKQRIVFTMRYFEEMKYEKISEILKTSVGSLKASYHHAVNKIENFLKEN